MAQINYETMQIVVENAMRTVGGMSGTEDMENAWKDEYAINGTTIKSPNNLQNLRDSISRAIVDSLNATVVTGEISNGSTPAPNQQVVTTSSSVNINNQLPVPSPAARVGDTVTSTAISDVAFWAWVTSVSSSLSIPAPVAIISKISTGSSSVNIGG